MECLKIVEIANMFQMGRHLGIVAIVEVGGLKEVATVKIEYDSEDEAVTQSKRLANLIVAERNCEMTSIGLSGKPDEVEEMLEVILGNMEGS